MRVLLIADTHFATHEHAMLRRIEVAAAEDGRRVVLAHPDTTPAPAPSPFASHIAYPSREWRSIKKLTARARASALGSALESLDLPSPTSEGADRPIDVIHALGDGCWPIAFALADLLSVPLCADVHSPRALAEAVHIHAARSRRGVDSPVAWLAPDAPALARLQSALPAARARLAPWGVFLPPSPSRALARPKDVAISLVIAGSGADPAAARSLLAGLASLPSDAPSTLLFLDSSFLSHRHSLYRDIRALNLLDRLSIIDNLEGHRAIALRADVLLLPEALSLHNTLLLDALAAPLAIIAAADPAIEALTASEGPVLLTSPTPADWTEAVLALLKDPEGARHRALKGRPYIERDRQASAHTRAVLAAYEALANSGPLPFTQGAGRVVTTPE